MTTAKNIITKATNENNGLLDKTKLETMLIDSGVEPDQDWEENTTTWRFEDDSAIRDQADEIHVYGLMPKTNKWGWYLVSV